MQLFNLNIIKKIPLWIKNRLGILIFLFLFGWFLHFADHHQGKVEKRYGFSVVTPDLSIWPRVEVLMLNSVDSASVFDKAGFKAGDIILKQDYNSVCGFLNSLNHLAGTDLWLEVIDLDDFDPHLYLKGKCKKHKNTFIAP